MYDHRVTMQYHGTAVRRNETGIKERGHFACADEEKFGSQRLNLNTSQTEI